MLQEIETSNDSTPVYFIDDSSLLNSKYPTNEVMNSVPSDEKISSAGTAHASVLRNGHSMRFSILEVLSDDGQVTITWNVVPLALQYTVEYGKSSNTYTKTMASVISPLTITGLDNASTYYFRAMAISSTGIIDTTPEVSVVLPQMSGLQPYQLGLLVNDNDPDSVVIAEYYQKRRQIPSENVVHLNISITVRLFSSEFMPLKAKVDSALPKTVQALAIAWKLPYRVGCNSITSAFALGYMENACKASCSFGNASLYYNSSSTAAVHRFQYAPSHDACSTYC